MRGHAVKRIILLGVSLLGAAVYGNEQLTLDAEDSAGRSKSAEPCRTWTLRIDNDLFAAQGEDRDYTAGISATLIDRRGRSLAAPVRRALNWLDKRAGLDVAFASESQTNDLAVVELGIALFTPIDLEPVNPVETDRPYASLLYLSSSHSALNNKQSKLRQSTLTVGLLGAPVSGALHRGAHRLFHSAQPRGYSRQISAGGELTARYGVASHLLLQAHQGERAAYDLKVGVEGNIGYLTEGAVSLGVRWGRISSPWWSSVSDHADYNSQPSLVTVGVGASRDLYFSMGLKLRARVYNAFLQGQFRSSTFSYSASDLHSIIGEAWFGVIADIRRLRVSYTLRYQTPELRRGVGAYEYRWAGITVTRTFR